MMEKERNNLGRVINIVSKILSDKIESNKWLGKFECCQNPEERDENSRPRMELIESTDFIVHEPPLSLSDITSVII